MNKTLSVINILWAIADVLICLAGIAAFAWGAWAFGKWWLLLFNILILALYNQHSLVVDADLERAKEADDD